MSPRHELHDGKYARPPENPDRRHGYFKIVETWETSCRRSARQDAMTSACKDLIAVLSPYLTTEEHQFLCRPFLDREEKATLPKAVTEQLRLLLEHRHGGSVDEKLDADDKTPRPRHHH